MSAVIDAARTLEGGGFPVRRPFPTQRLAMVDPFLLLDEMGPVEWAPGEATGAPDHPHRGFETVTYLLEGRMAHRDSAGHAGQLGPGDVQWMTAGAGVVHSELYEEEFRRRGGRAHGFQLWVNLPARDKMTAPRYQEVPGAQLPEVTASDGRVRARVIAGEALGVAAVIHTRTPIVYVHYTIAPGGEAAQRVPADHEGFVYVFGGEVLVGGERRPVRDGQAAILGAGDELPLAVAPGAAGPASLLVIAGVPLREPVARYGPFVMNTRDEIARAFDDYRAGRLGRIGP